MADFDKPIKVVVMDPETNEVLADRIIHNDYIVITSGNRYVKHMQFMGRTAIFSVAVAKPEKQDGK